MSLVAAHVVGLAGPGHAGVVPFAARLIAPFDRGQGVQSRHADLRLALLLQLVGHSPASGKRRDVMTTRTATIIVIVNRR